ncbi:MAG: FRG domain-containing protein [bacterium]|nr:FRG domain-containing protein [bacterium]
MKELGCDNWSEFKELLSSELYDGQPATRKKFLFRGHGSSDWQLAPSFDRVFVDFEGGERDQLEDDLLENFKKECESEPELRDLLDDEAATLALAQHYGLPTRLLDWTESPYVAAFFAFQGHFQDSMFGKRMGKTVAIWVLDPSSYIWSRKRGVQLLAPASWDNERLRKQAGWFTLSRTPQRNLVEYVTAFDDAGGALRMITIPSSEARVAIPDLDLMGVNHSTLFSDLEGKARSSVTRTLLSFGRQRDGLTEEVVARVIPEAAAKHISDVKRHDSFQGPELGSRHDIGAKDSGGEPPEKR